MLCKRRDQRRGSPRRCWEDKVHAALHLRRGDHEDDQQNEGEIEQRRDVELAQGLQCVAIGEAAHIYKRRRSGRCDRT
jgi:hypothetical protein